MGYRQISKIFFIILALIGLPSLAAYYNLGGFWRATTVAATQIYRSVGPSKTTPLACGTAGGSCPGATGNLTISGTTATFASALPSNVGVGDTIVYDCTAGGGYTAADCIAFISGRTNSTIYTVQSSTGSTPTAFAANNTWQLYRAYSSMQDAFDGDENSGIIALNATLADFDSGPRDITTGATQGILNFALYADASDTTGADLDNYTTSATYYIRIYTPYLSTEVGTSQRHQGYWNSGGYLMDPAGTGNGVGIYDNFVKLDGLRVLVENPAAWAHAIEINNQGANSRIYVSNNLITITGSNGGSTAGLIAYSGQAATTINYIYNNVVYTPNESVHSGISTQVSAVVSYIYNNTVYGAEVYGIFSQGSNTVLKNNIVQNTGGGGSSYATGGSWAAGTGYNIANDGWDPGLTGDLGNVTVQFRDIANGDFRLADYDVYAKDNGLDLSADANLAFTNDASNTTRGGIWDRGALEANGGSRAIYRSVGTDTGILQSGAGNDLTIAGTNANFASALPNNIGVGDAIQYDSDGGGSVDSIAFISGRYSSTSFKVQSTNGSTPTATSSADQDWAIYRSYTNLIDAENGDENTNISGNVRPFETWSGGANLTTNNWQWNIACYADTNDDDYQVVFGGWTTGPNNYLRIYTPYASTEVGTSQRHSGKWTTSGYRLNIVYDVAYPVAGAAINFSVKYVRFEGIQLRLEGTAGTGSAISFCNGVACSAGAGEYYFTENLIYTDYRNPSAGWEPVFDIWYSPTNTATKFYLANNIIYSMGADNAPVGIGVDSTIGNTYLYNNTVATADVGIDNNRAGTLAINNIVQDSAADAYDGSAAFNATSNYNISDDATKPGGANDITTGAVTFVNATNYDYQLSSRDTVALGTGTNLTNDSLFPISKDVHTYTRYTPWDIGASVPVSAQATTARYRSLGTNGSSLASGTNATLTVSNYTANFSSNLPNTVGMGDVLQYDTNSDGAIDTSDSLAFVKERISATTLMVERSNGTMPTSVTNGSGGVNWNIYRAYTSMAMALNGTENTSLDDDLENFDTLPKDLNTAQEQWNIVAYTGSDTSAAAAPTATINGWNTSSTKYLKVFSPRGPNYYESGQSYRHQGYRDTNLYEISHTAASTQPTLVINDENVQIDGIQIRSQGNTNNKHNLQIGTAAMATSTDVRLSNNIMTASWSANTHGMIQTGSNANLTTNGTVKVWNNILVGNGSYIGTGYLTTNGGTHYVYHNTFAKLGVPINASGLNTARLTAKGNNAQYAGDYNCGSRCTAASDYNMSDSAGNTGGANDITVTDSEFVDWQNDKLLLAIYDTNTVNNGPSLAADANIPFNTDILGNPRPTNGTNWDLGAHERDSASNSINLVSLTAVSNTPSSFDATVAFSGDANTNATVTLYYCNDTDSSGCNPLSGSSVTMTRSGYAYNFTANLTSLASSWDPGDVLNLKVVAVDSDGVTNSPLTGTITILNTIRYRSVGYTSTSALVTGTNNSLTIAGSNATFAVALPDNIGVGDALLYDADSNGNISSAGDSLAFIQKRVSNTQYIVKTNANATPVVVTNDTDWKIFRAFTSVDNAFGGIENTGIQAANGNAAIYNFDGGTFKNLVTNTHIRAIALYDDVEDTEISDVGSIQTSGYTTNGSYYVRTFTPYLATEVGRSQRHIGAWYGPGFMMRTWGCETNNFWIGSNYERLEGIKIYTTASGGGWQCPITTNAAYLRFISNYIRMSGHTDNSMPRAIHYWVGPTEQIVTNNIFAQFKGWNGSEWEGNSATFSGGANGYLFNNTFYNSGDSWAGGFLVAINNLVQTAIINPPFSGSSFLYSGYNIVNTTNATNAVTDLPNITDVTFVNAIDGDFRLSSSDIRAINAGTSLAGDVGAPFTEDAFGTTKPSGATWDIGAMESASGGIADPNKSYLMTIAAQADSDKAFTVTAFYVGDENNDSTATLWYCNNTDSSNCDPTGGTSVGMTKRSGFFYARVTDLASPNDPLDTLNLRVIISDADGISTYTYSKTTDYKNTTVTLDATVMYRSVGFNSTTALSTGTGNNLTISGSNATFGSALANNIGVGDAIEYDSDSDGIIDKIAFIRKRVTASDYVVQTNAGATPTAVTNDQDWSIFRAYTSMANATNGTENLGTNSIVRNFDPAAYNLSGTNKSYFVAAYADATDTSQGYFTTAWSTNFNKRIKVFTPVSSTEVGTSQRHTGSWGSGGYRIQGCNAIRNDTKAFQAEGLTVDMNSTTNTCNGIYSYWSFGGGTSGDIRINHNIVKRTAVSGTNQTGILVDGDWPSNRNLIWNNVIYDFTTGYGIQTLDTYSVVVSNTINNCNAGIETNADPDQSYITNNIVQNTTNGYSYYSGDYLNTGYNISSSSSTTAGGGTNILNTNAVVFQDSANGDFRLSNADATAKDAGVTFPLVIFNESSTNTPFVLIDDIEGNIRPVGTHWSIGAHDK